VNIKTAKVTHRYQRLTVQRCDFSCFSISVAVIRKSMEVTSGCTLMTCDLLYDIILILYYIILYFMLCDI